MVIFAVQTPAVVSHQWVDKQSESLAHTLPHTPVVRLQIGPPCAGVPFVQPVAPVPFSVQSAQPPPARQKGAVVLGHCSGAPEPLSAVHAAQLPEEVLHAGVLPVHCVRTVALHCVHDPFDWHAGESALGHARVAALPKSPLQPAHVPVAVSQAEVVPLHAAVLPALHCVHEPASGPAVWQTPCPALGQANGVALPKLPSHPVHAPVVSLQSGVVPTH